MILDERFERLWAANEPALRRMVPRLLGGRSAEDREDAFAIARLRAWRSFRNYDDSLSFCRWSGMFVRSACREAMKRARSRPPALNLIPDEDGETALDRLADTRLNPEESLMAAALAEFVTAAPLCASQRRALEIVAAGGDDFDVARELGGNRYSACTLLSRAKRTVRRSVLRSSNA